MILKIFLKTRDSISFKRFSLLINSLNTLKIFLKSLNYKKKTTHFSILKSPHVNKKSQEQFGYTEFKNLIIVTNIFSLKIILFIKRILFRIFPDISFKIEFSNIQKNKMLYCKNLKSIRDLFYYTNKKGLT